MERKKIQVPIPVCVQQYNKYMGVVDLLDNSVSCYRVPYRMKKWWFPVYAWSLNVGVVNAWRLRMKTTGKKEPLLNFLRELVVEMLSVHGNPANPMKTLNSPSDSLRTDGLNHWIVSSDVTEDRKKQRMNCRQCSKAGQQGPHEV